VRHRTLAVEAYSSIPRRSGPSMESTCSATSWRGGDEMAIAHHREHGNERRCHGRRARRVPDPRRSACRDPLSGRADKERRPRFTSEGDAASARATSTPRPAARLPLPRSPSRCGPSRTTRRRSATSSAPCTRPAAARNRRSSAA
jgi:hypothetical protein